MVRKMEAVYDPFFVTLGKAMWTLLYAIDKVAAFYVTMDFIDAHPETIFRNVGPTECFLLDGPARGPPGLPGDSPLGNGAKV
jgi:hypothetical protein